MKEDEFDMVNHSSEEVMSNACPIHPVRLHVPPSILHGRFVTDYICTRFSAPRLVRNTALPSSLSH